MRLIDADKLRECFEENSKKTMWGCGLPISVYDVNDVILKIDAQPTVNVNDKNINREGFKEDNNMKIPEDAVLKVAMHDGGVDNWRIGSEFDNYKVTGNALVLTTGDGALIGWYNLNDVKMFYITDHE